MYARPHPVARYPVREAIERWLIAHLGITIDGTTVPESSGNITIDGTDVTEVTVDGTTVWTADAIPDSVIHHYPADEGSGSTIADSVGSADVTDFNGTWTSDGAFKGGTAPFFDRTDDDATVSATNPSAYTWAVRVRADSLGTESPTDRMVFSHAFDPVLKYNIDSDVWRFNDGASRAEVADSQSAVEGSIRYLFSGLNASTAELHVYDETKTLVGSDSFPSPNQTYTTSTRYIGDDGGGSRRWGGEIDNWYFADELFDSSDRQQILDQM